MPESTEGVSEGRYIKGRKPDRTAIWGYVYGHSYTEVKKKMTMRKAAVRACALSEQNPTFQELSHNWEQQSFLHKSSWAFPVPGACVQ